MKKEYYYLATLLCLIGSNLYIYTDNLELKEKNSKLENINKQYDDRLDSIESKYQSLLENQEDKNINIQETLNKIKNDKKQLETALKATKNSQEQEDEGNFDLNPISTSLLSTRIENMSEVELKENLEKFLSLKDTDLPKNMDLRDFIRKVIKIGLLKDIDEGDVFVDPDPRNINFDTKPSIALEKEPIKSFDTNTSKIFSNINLIDMNLERILVKWYNTEPLANSITIK